MAYDRPKLTQTIDSNIDLGAPQTGDYLAVWRGTAVPGKIGYDSLLGAAAATLPEITSPASDDRVLVADGNTGLLKGWIRFDQFGTGGGGPGLYQITIDEIKDPQGNNMRSKFIFDSAGQLGLAYANVPVAGTGTPGQQVRVRAQSYNDGGAAYQDAWNAPITIAGDGTWSGTIQVSRSVHWLELRAEIVGDSNTADRTTVQFAAGHIITELGQSERAQMLINLPGEIAFPTITDPDALQIVKHDGHGSVTHFFVQSGNPNLTAATCYMSNAYAAEAPGIKFLVNFDAVSGTSYYDLVTDAISALREWSSSVAAYNAATQNGLSPVGLASQAWRADPSGHKGNFQRDLTPIYVEEDMNGNPLVIPGLHNGIQIDHSMLELYDYAYTKWVFYTHKYDGVSEATGDFAWSESIANMQDKRTSLASQRAWVNNPNASGYILKEGFACMSYQNGEVARYEAGMQGNSDIIHPAADDRDGMSELAIKVAYVHMNCLGHFNAVVPSFDTVVWDPAYVTVSSSAGPITTAQYRLDGTTDVAGFEVNNVPATATLQGDGTIRVFHPTNPSFNFADVLTFGRGGGSGYLLYPDDYLNRKYRKYPGVDLGAAYLGQIDILPLEDAATFANTIAQPTNFFTKDSGSGAHLLSPNWSALSGDGSQLTVDMRIKIKSGGPSNAKVLEVKGNYLSLSFNTANNTLSLKAKSGAGVDFGATLFTPNNAVTLDSWMDVRVVCDFGDSLAGRSPQLRMFINDVLQTEDTAWTGTDGTFPANRAIRYLYFFHTIDTEFFRVWYTAETDGSLPATAPDHEVLGPAAIANADPWTVGTFT